MRKLRHSKQYQRLITALREVREEAGLTQSEVAGRFGAHASFISKIESGERRIDVIELSEFCKTYGLTLRAFLDRVGLI